MKRIQMKKIGFAAAIICCSLSACKQEPNLTGTWLEPIPEWKIRHKDLH